MNGISIERLRIDDGHHDILGDVRIIGEVIDKNFSIMYLKIHLLYHQFFYIVIKETQ